MGTVPVPRTWGVGPPPDYKDRPPYSIFNQELYTNLEFLLNPPMCKLYSTGQAIPNAAWTPITWQVEEVDTDNMHSSTNATRITPKTPGYYIGSMGIGFGSTSSSNDTVGRRLQALRKNGTTYISRYDSRPAGTTGADKPLKANPFMVFCNGTTDYIEVICYQESTVSLGLYNGTTDIERASQVYCRWYSSP